MKDDPVINLATAFGPILLAAFPNEHSVTRFQVANALAEAALASPPAKPAPADGMREREQIVAYLRKVATKRSDHMKADAIERGDFLPTEGGDHD